MPTGFLKNFWEGRSVMLLRRNPLEIEPVTQSKIKTNSILGWIRSCFIKLEEGISKVAYEVIDEI